MDVDEPQSSGVSVPTESPQVRVRRLRPPQEPHVQNGITRHKTARRLTVAVFAAYALVPVSIGFAVLRYRLYDIDKIVSRTVSYAVITATLAGVYAGGVALATGVLPFSGQAGTAASVLAAMALFAPLRRRVQRAVDRRFNRARYDAEAVTAAFARQMREPAGIDTVRAGLTAAVTQTLDPAHVSLWVRGEPGRPWRAPS